MPRDRDPLRARLALGVGRGVAAASRSLGRGSGSMIGGRLALRLDPGVLRAVTGGRRGVLVTGTNGKSTVTALVSAALGPVGPVATNATGANMTDGIVTALDADPASPVLALEVDEVYLGAVAAGTRPRALVALNCVREYTRGVSLAATLQHWRRVADSLPEDCTAVVNVDDPLVTWAFESAPRTVGVSGGLYWTQDAELCPACGTTHDFGPDGWSCPGCGRRRPTPDWDVESDGEGYVVTHAGRRIPVSVSVPGRTGPVGAAFALAAAAVMGVDPEDAAERVRSVVDVDGRYAPYFTGTHTARLLMLKNPAGWAEAIDVAVSSGRELVVAVDPFGPKDTTTMWEAPFDRLAGREVAVTGGRTADVLAILDAAGVRGVPATDVDGAIGSRRPGEVVVACNYPAFRRLARQFRGARA